MPQLDVPNDRRAAPTIVTTSVPVEPSVHTVPVSGLDDLMPEPPVDQHLGTGGLVSDYDDSDQPTMVIDDEGDDTPTMVYEEEPRHPICMLRRVSTGENMRVENYPATVGRGSDAALRVSGNRYVGRIHARISERGGQLYVADQGSANHTYLNGMVLSPYEDVQLSDGDVLSLAKEEFRVTITKG